ncbi:hypothetical protein NFHSH190041_37090 (plasmid) [Shewanella sp. NFH-SH190041]|nr:hypothetical protein NFHSH190041_37090 [Shewanella sp. NFH-SH190041]
MPSNEAEIYFGPGNWKKSDLAMKGKIPVMPAQIYAIDTPDPRLMISIITNPTAEQINQMMAQELAAGWEGLVLRQGDTWIKVKKKETHDTPIIGVNKKAGRVISLATHHGNVGNLSAALKKQIQHDEGAIIGRIVEIECMELTKNGKFREPRIIRVRDDKTPQNIVPFPGGVA